MKPKFSSELKIEKDKSGVIKVNDKFHQEILKDMQYGLSAYESICASRQIQNFENIEFTKAQIDKVIKEVLRCNICFEIFQNPVCIKGCLHKFCKQCISDYIFKIKKECAICRHPIETKRLLKEDDLIKEVINSFIPDREKYKAEEEKIILNQIKNCSFKDGQKFKKQLEKARKEDEKELEELKANSRLNNSADNSKNLLNRKTNRDSHKHNNSTIEKKEEINEPAEDIIVRIICDPKDEELQKYFKFTRMKVEGSHTLEFISRFICYKQNFKCEQINKINFYTFDNNSKKKYWNQNDKICDVVSYDSKISNKNKNNQDKNKENFYINLYHLNLNFYIND